MSAWSGYKEYFQQARMMQDQLDTHLQGGPLPNTKQWVNETFDIMKIKYQDDPKHMVRKASTAVLTTWRNVMWAATEKLIRSYD